MVAVILNSAKLCGTNCMQDLCSAGVKDLNVRVLQVNGDVISCKTNSASNSQDALLEGQHKCIST